MARYLLIWTLSALLLICLVAAINLTVDPYGIFRLVDRAGLNAIKPTATTRGGLAKAVGVAREKPSGLVLGNSRAEVGFDPNHTSWPNEARPSFNLSIAGTAPTTTLRYLKHALSVADIDRRPITTILWGIDFMDFLVDSKSLPGPDSPSSEERRLLQAAEAEGRTEHWAQRLKDAAESTLTLRALFDSVLTVAAQSDEYSMDQTRRGFNPMRDYEKIAKEQGYWVLFRQKDLAYIQSFLNRPVGIFDARGNRSKEIDATREILRLCRDRGIALHIVVYPYHAHFQQTFRITGQWDAFETWKTAVVRLVGEEARTSRQPAFPVWDFSGFSEWTSERVPARGDRTAQMRWYWEAGHFKSELGVLVMNRVWNQSEADERFGILINEENIESHIKNVRAEEQRYRSENRVIVSELEMLVSQMKNGPRLLKRK